MISRPVTLFWQLHVPVIKQFTAVFKSTLEERGDFEKLVYGEIIRLVMWRYLMLVSKLSPRHTVRFHAIGFTAVLSRYESRN